MLNKEQQQAVNNPDGTTLVIAGAGSGKTEVLARRVESMLVSDQGINPNMVLLLTFTESGVAAMRKRLVKYIGPTAYKIHINTFHGMCNEIIQSRPDYFGVREFEPVSELERIEISYKILDNLLPAHPLKRLRGDVYYDSRRMLNLFSIMKKENWDAKHIQDASNIYLQNLPNKEEYIYKRGNKKKGIEIGDVKKALIDKEVDKMKLLVAAAKLLDKYNEMLKASERYDFSDMIHWVLDAWTNDDDFLLSYQERYQYLLLDEFQDQNKSQADLVTRLMDYWDTPNIFAVGDTQQCLYEFQGARIQNIIDFKETYNPELIIFTENYRSNQHIIDHAENVIVNTEEKMGMVRKLHAATDKGEAYPKVLGFDNLAMETCWIADDIEKEFKKGNDVSQIGIIYRKHRQADDLIQQFEARGVPYKIKRSVNVLDSTIVRQLLDILSFIVNYDELRQDTYDSLLFRILHFSFLGNDHQKIHRYYMLLQDKEARSRKPVDYIKTEKILDGLVKLYHNKPLIVLINHILEDTGLMEWVVKSKDYMQTIQYINTFFNWVKTEVFKDINLNGKQLIQKIDKMRKNGLFLSVIDISGQNTGVNLLTMHGAKGLEFEKVIIMGAIRSEMEASRTPATSFKLPDTLTLSSAENKLESNRRLFYVGMTRAEKELFITYAVKNNDGKELEPTQFISESGIGIDEVPEVDLTDYLRYQFKSPKIVLDVDKAVIQDKLDNFTMSVSALNKYLKCPVQFYFENIIRIPFIATPALIFGNGVHLALKHLYDAAKSGHEMNYNQFFDVFAKYMKRQLAQLTKLEYDSRMELGKRTLKYYYDEIYPKSNKVTVNEFKFNRIVIDGVPCKGDMDKGEFDGRLVTIKDYKTGSIIYAKKNLKPPSEKEPQGRDYWRQGGFYKLMLDHFQAQDWKFNGVAFDMIGDSEFESLPIEILPKDENMLRKLIVEVYGKIMNAEFTEGCGEEDCVWCNLLK